MPIIYVFAQQDHSTTGSPVGPRSKATALPEYSGRLGYAIFAHLFCFNHLAVSPGLFLPAMHAQIPNSESSLTGLLSHRHFKFRGMA